MQLDVFLNPIRRARASYPYIVVLQSDYVDDQRRLVAPLIEAKIIGVARAAPVVPIEGVRFKVLLLDMFAIPATLLRRPVDSIAAYRDDIVRALDWLFTGI